MEETINNLIKTVFGKALWNSTSLLEKVGSNSDLGKMILIGYVFAALMLIFQTLLMVLNIAKNKQVWENVGPLAFRIILIALLMSPPVYNLIFRYIIAGSTNMVADYIFGDYAADFLTSWKNIFASGGKGSSTAFGFITASFVNSLVTNILSSIIFLAAVVCVFIVSMLQPYIWLFCFYCGPICLAFAVCDLTIHVAQRWLSLFLIVNFVGVFGSITFAVAQGAGLVSNFGVGTAGNNIILVAVYGVMSIIFFCLIWPMTGYIFGGHTPLGSIGSPAGALKVVGTVASGAMLYGAGMAMTGGLLTKMAAQGSAINGMGQGMRSFGNSLQKDAGNIKRVVAGRPPSNYQNSPQKGSQSSEPSV